MMRFGVAVGVWLACGVLLSGCGRPAMEAKSAAAPPMSPSPISAEAAVAPPVVSDSATNYESKGSLPGSAMASAPSAPASDAVAGAPVSDTREMLDIEAHVSLLVANVASAGAQLRRLATARGGTITSDVSEDVSGARQINLTIRVPSGANDSFLADLEPLGEVTGRQITAKDVGREYHDSEVVLHNLERTLTRYEEILQKAQSVEEILKIEAELSRIRGEIDRVKGELRYLGDRTSRSTVFVSMHERTQEIAQEPEQVAKFFPGLRAVSLTELRGSRKTVSAFGGGLVVGAGRSLNLEVDALGRVDSHSGGFDAVLATVGGDAYSDFLGGGKRRFLNPYLGLRAGYARITGSSDFAIGATLGVELWKTNFATIDCDLRALGLLGKDGSELGLMPTLGANVAF